MFAYENFVFVQGTEDREKTLLNREWVHSVTACKQEYLAKYPDLQIQETSLETHIRGDVINRFVRTGNLNKGKFSPFSI